MPTEANILNIGLTKSAHFYKVKDGRAVDASMWERICETIKGGIVKPSSNFVSTDLTQVLIDRESVHYGLCVFRLGETVPSFAKDINDFWTERKLGYFIMVEYNEYVAIQSRNITTPNCLLNALVLIDYLTLTALNNNSSYSKISMKNLDGGANAMRARTFVADDLSKSMSALGANHYMLSAFNGKNGNGKTFAVTTSTARIAERAQTIDITDYCVWVKYVIVGIQGINQPQSTDLLSIFAEYVDYKEEFRKGHLVPNSLLLNIWEIYDKLEQAQCALTYNIRGNDIHITPDNLMSYLEECAKEPILLSNIGNEYRDRKKRISVALKEENIIISGTRLKSVQISSQQEPEYNGSLARLINRYGLFNVYFDNIDVIYTQGGLYKNHNLLRNYEQLLGILRPIDGLNDNTVEKIRHGNGRQRNSFQGVNSWDHDSMFQIVENTFMNNFDYFICDDMEDEWADHIGISKNKVSFFVEKCDDSKYSASAFQEVIGQALKNIGNLTPLDATKDDKRNKWSGVHTTSTIDRWRNKREGASIEDAIQLWMSNRTNPNYEKEMCLVVNFIAIDDFRSDLQNINNLNDTRKATTFQRVWLLSSFINACMEAGVKPVIYCRPLYNIEENK